MARWFRLYDEVLDDPKVQRLEPRLFKTWVNIMCAASKRGGAIPPIDELAFMLRMTEEEVGRDFDALLSAGLIDEIDGTATPHNWEGRQFQSDSSTERVQRFRNGRRNVSETPDETPPDTDTDTDTDTEDKHTCDRAFEEFWKAFPKREGANPKKTARLAYSRALKRGGTPDTIAAAAKTEAAKHPVPTQFVPMASTWLNQDRWQDQESTGPPQNVVKIQDADEYLAELAEQRRAGQERQAVSGF